MLTKRLLPPQSRKPSLATRLSRSLPALGVLVLIVLAGFGGGAGLYKELSRPVGASDIETNCPSGQIPTETTCAPFTLSDAAQAQYLDQMVALYATPVGSERTAAVKKLGTITVLKGSVSCFVGNKVGGVCVGMLPPAEAHAYAQCSSSGAEAGSCASYAACLSEKAVGACGTSPTLKATASPTLAATSTPATGVSAAPSASASAIPSPSVAPTPTPAESTSSVPKESSAPSIATQ
jgi:hypothetical protein